MSTLTDKDTHCISCQPENKAVRVALTGCPHLSQLTRRYLLSINLVENTALGEVDFLRFLPAAKNRIVD